MRGIARIRLDLNQAQATPDGPFPGPEGSAGVKVLLFLDPYSHEGFRNPHDKGNEAVWLIPLVSPALAGNPGYDNLGGSNRVDGQSAGVNKEIKNLVTQARTMDPGQLNGYLASSVTNYGKQGGIRGEERGKAERKIRMTR
ncbi:hypothetical protein PCH_Pc16g13130 [Penicillium rubens Wisconsin 54-1255]|uniref:Uncharacterized protein n=1 Tax=Penicillium rubens (strain ATCC 28089 / DSM 1075 / NRRL 1951 / Wisconsin 54-1255) TaxID=500485 RepID=B6HAK4_PENRW|nr:hypothetical protein PCH_Pc16g13130 [Penicillium rubens Wisconsin 54-1255]